MDELDRYFGRMNAPTAAAFVRGVCGDEMEFWLDIGPDRRIRDVRVHVNGCETAQACAATTAQLIDGISVENALEVSARAVLEKLPSGYESAEHCAILAITTMYRALAQYLLQP